MRLDQQLSKSSDKRSAPQNLVLNGFRVDLSAPTFTCYTQPCADNGVVRQLREAHRRDWFLYWREGIVYGLPRNSAPSSTFGKETTLTCNEHLSLLVARLDDLIPQKFPRYKAFKFRPFSFVGQKDEIVATIRNQLRSSPRLLDGFQIFPSFELEAKIIEPDDTDTFLGVFFNVRTRWRIAAALDDLQKAGVDLRGLAVIRRERKPGERALVGTVRKLTDGVVALDESFENTKEIAADAASIEGSKTAFVRCLRVILGEQYQRFEEQRRLAESKLMTGVALNAALERLESAVFRKSPTFDLTPGLECTVAGRIQLKNRPDYRSVIVAPPVQYCFDPARSKQSEFAWTGLRQHGPFSRSTFSRRSPHILVIYPDVAQGPVEKMLRALRDGVGQQFSGGFARLFSLVNPVFDECKIALMQGSNKPVGSAYRDAIEEKLASV